MPINAKIMPHGWMSPNKPCFGRPKTRRCLGLLILWAVIVLVGGITLGIETDGVLPDGSIVYWATLAPGPVFAGLAIYFRWAEPPRHYSRRQTPWVDESPVIH